jgi:rubrerythrin
MIKIDRQRIHEIENSTNSQELQRHLQAAVELEHAAIPPYLTAMYSLVPGKNEKIVAIIRSVVIEEMLHMTIAANILVAIGGSPQINKPEFIVKYPGPLPMGIEEDLIIPIKAFSKDLVHNVFMAMEEPEFPPVSVNERQATIGEYYRAIQKKISELGDGIFVVGADKQVLSWFNSKLLFAIVDVKSANAALEIVITQGEGTPHNPFEAPGILAHYYRFKEIYLGYDYAGKAVPFDLGGVYPMIENPKQSDYDPGSQAALLSTTFSFAYSSMLNALQRCFNGEPRMIDSALGLMYQLRLQAQELMTTPIRPGCPHSAGPVFKYVTQQ